MKYFALVALACITCAASADVLTVEECPIFSIDIGSQLLRVQEFEINWSRATTRENQVPLPYTELSSYRVYWVNHLGTVKDQIVKTVNRRALQTKIKQPLCTTYHYAVTASDIDKRESKLSNVVSVTTACPNN